LTHGASRVVPAADGSRRTGLRGVVAAEMNPPERLANRLLPPEPALAEPRQATPALNAGVRSLEDVARRGEHLLEVGSDSINERRVIERRQCFGARPCRQRDEASSGLSTPALGTPGEERVVAQELE